MIVKGVCVTVLIEIAVMREGANLIQALLRLNANSGIGPSSTTQAALCVADVLCCFNDLNRPDIFAASLRAFRILHPELVSKLPVSYRWLEEYGAVKVAKRSASAIAKMI